MDGATIQCCVHTFDEAVDGHLSVGVAVEPPALIEGRCAEGDVDTLYELIDGDRMIG